MALELQLPEQSAAGRGDPALSPRRLRRWLATAAGARPPELARRLHGRLAHLNGLALDPRLRLRLLDTLRPSARAALDALGGRIQGAHLPPTAAERTAFERALELLDALALGYAGAARDAAAAGRRKPAALGVQRALGCHGEAMLRWAQSYRRPPDALWANANATYALAEQAGSADRAVRDPELPGGKRAQQSPRAAFKRLLLLALADCQVFPRREAARLANALVGWCALAELTTADDTPDPGPARFTIDLGAARPPRPTGPDNRPRGPDTRVLDAAGLVERIEGLLATTAPDDGLTLRGPDEPGAAALAHLVGSWRPEHRPRPTRAPVGLPADVTMSLRAIYRRLGATANGRTAAAEGPGPEPPDGADDDAGHEGFGIEISWEAIEDAESDGADPPAADPGGRAEAPPPPTATGGPAWRLLDWSSGGFGLSWALSWDGSGNTRATVGELVLLRVPPRSDDGPGRWLVGLVRRMRLTDDEHFEIGVHQIGEQPRPVPIRRAPDDDDAGTRFRDSEPVEPGLLIGAESGRGTASSVLLPAQMFRSGSIIELDVDDRILRRRLAACLEATDACAWFRLQPVEDRALQSAPAAGAAADPAGP